MKKKLLALLLCAALLIAAMSGCGSSPGTTAEETSEEESQSVQETTEASETAQEDTEAAETSEAAEPETTGTEETDETEEPAESAEPSESAEDDSEGDSEEETEESLTLTDTIATLPNGTEMYPLSDGTQTITFMNSFSMTPNNMVDETSDIYAIQEAERRTGVHVEFKDVNMMSFSEQLNLMIAAQDYCDIMYGVNNAYSGSIDTAIEDEVIVDLTEYKDYAPNFFYVLEHNEAVAKDSTTDTGKIGAFYKIQAGTDLPNFGVYIRTDILESYDIDDPVTIDDYTELLAIYKEEGLTYPFWLKNDMTTVFAYAYGVIGGDGSNDDLFYQEDGVVHFSPLESGYKDYIAQMAEWCAAGYISEDFPFISSISATMETSEVYKAIGNGSAGVVENGTSIMQTIEGEDGFDPLESYTAMPMPVLEEGDQIHLGDTLYTLDEWSGCSVSTTCENIELAIGWLDYWYSEEGAWLMTYGEEGTSYTYDEEGRVVFTDLILDDETYTATQMWNAYAYVSSACGLVIGSSDGPMYGYDSIVVQIPEIWAGDHFGSDWVISNKLTMTADETREFSSILTDALTYIAENVPRFVLGERSMDEWDAFIEELESSFDIDRMLEIEQAAVDRYIAR